MKKKLCNGCGKTKAVSQFWKSSSNTTGFQSQCKDCFKNRDRNGADKRYYTKPEVKARIKKDRQENPKKYYLKDKNYREKYPDKVKNMKLVATYGITLDSVREIEAEQDSCCALCGTHASEYKKGLHVDHCHESGSFRGILCSKCNTALGLMNDDPHLLRQAADYIERHRKAG